MGKGDKKTRRGKITIGSTGVRRPRKKMTRKPFIPARTSPLPKETPETAPLAVVPETVPVVEQVEEKPPKKTTAKPAAKKSSSKTAEGEAKPKQAKPRKKPAKPAEELPSGSKEGTE